VITAADLEARLAPLRAIGREPETGGTTRLAWTPEDDAAGAWFAQQAAAAGLTVARDPAGNRWATPPGAGPWWAVGSHTDSVRDGGAYDGALGVAAGFAIAAHAPVAVIAFADEEGARFNTPTFGSRALTGALDVAGVLARRDDQDVQLADALRAVGVDPDGLATAPGWLPRLRGFFELHIDQSTELAGAGAPAGVVSALVSRLRARVTVSGTADHAGTTPPEQRRDALLAAARVIAAADDLRTPELRTTAGRIRVAPNALTSIASSATVWLDARSPSPDALATWLAAVEGATARIAAATRTEIAVAVESRGAGVTFDAGLRARLGGPEVVCWAGHDAGVLAPHVPAAMVLVRNATGVSHAAAEHVALQDAAAGATLIAGALTELTA
jgi:N-carbamoyl-L-amino-acid hydrolase